MIRNSILLIVYFTQIVTTVLLHSGARADLDPRTGPSHQVSLKWMVRRAAVLGRDTASPFLNNIKENCIQNTVAISAILYCIFYSKILLHRYYFTETDFFLYIGSFLFPLLKDWKSARFTNKFGNHAINTILTSCLITKSNCQTNIWKTNDNKQVPEKNLNISDTVYNAIDKIYRCSPISLHSPQ